MTEVFPFARHGNFTQIDNAIFDVVMPELTPHEWMVLSFILRKTLGWQKDIDGIAYSQFIKGTSVKSNTTIQKSLAKLNSMGIIEVLESKHKADPHHYRLNKNYSCRVTGNVTQPITLNVIRPVTGNVDTKESLKENIKNNNNIEKPSKAFERLTGFFPPHETTDQYKDKWLAPLMAIMNHSKDEDEAVKRVEYAVNASRTSEKKYPISSPKSIMTWALNYQPTQTMTISTDGSVNL